MDRRGFLGAGLAFGLVGCAVSGPVQLPPETTLYIVRHSDRDGEELNRKGRARSAALVAALAGMPVDAIYSPDLKRNLDTAAPLATERGLTVETRPPEAPTARLAQEPAGRAVLWVGNKGNLRTIWESLGLPEPVPLEYGDLAIVRSDAAGVVSVERRRFGPE